MITVPLSIVINNNKILLVLRRFPPLVWGPPGGFVDINETLIETAEREVYEETGITCKALDTIIYEFDAYNTHLVVFACKYVTGDLRCSYESKDLGWFEIDSLPSPISPSKECYKLALDRIHSNKR